MTMHEVEKLRFSYRDRVIPFSYNKPITVEMFTLSTDITVRTTSR